MGKTRWAVWGLLFATAALVGLLSLYTARGGAGGTMRTPSAPAPTPPARGALSGVTICLDAGHGGYDGGARARTSGVWEKEINLDVTLRLRALLQAEGARVILTRAEDTALAEAGKNRKRRDLQARVDAAAPADLFLSLHMNEYRDRAQSGPQVFYRQGADSGRLLAGAMQETLNRQLCPPRPRAANTGAYYLLERLSIPAVLVECGFLSNAAEEALLLDGAYRQRLAQAARDGVLAYLSLADAR